MLLFTVEQQGEEMMSKIISACLTLCCGALIMPFTASAADLPALPSKKPSQHKLFIASHSSQVSDEYDLWKIDGGYSYALFDSVDLYVGARVDNSKEESQNGFLSGVSYRFNDKVSLDSTFHSSQETQENGEKENVVSAEVTSRVQLSDRLHLRATLDYEEWQQGIELGLGFRF